MKPKLADTIIARMLRKSFLWVEREEVESRQRLRTSKRLQWVVTGVLQDFVAETAVKNHESVGQNDPVGAEVSIDAKGAVDAFEDIAVIFSLAVKRADKTGVKRVSGRRLSSARLHACQGRNDVSVHKMAAIESKVGLKTGVAPREERSLKRVETKVDTQSMAQAVKKRNDHHTVKQNERTKTTPTTKRATNITKWQALLEPNGQRQPYYGSVLRATHKQKAAL